MAVTNDMSADRRVARHARTLREAGYEVVVVCRSTKENKASEGLSPLSMQSPRGWRFYAEYNVLLWRRLMKLKPDAIWANDTDTLPGCWLAARMLRSKLVMDAHELFAEVPEIHNKPFVKWVWRTVDRLLMPHCDALLTVCQSVADYNRDKHGVSMVVVRNLPEKTDAVAVEPSADAWLPSIPAHTPLLLYQGSVNYGRGIDWAIDALEFLPECVLVVAGKGDVLMQMKERAAARPWADRIMFLGQVPPPVLPTLTRRAAVGLVMLEDIGLNYRFALPNRIGDFVAAGVPMVVSDMPEMAAVVRQFGVGEVIDGAGAQPLANAIKKVLAREWVAGDFAEARKDMDWDKEKNKLLKICYTTFC